jgi:hypothetical protein
LNSAEFIKLLVLLLFHCALDEDVSAAADKAMIIPRAKVTPTHPHPRLCDLLGNAQVRVLELVSGLTSMNGNEQFLIDSRMQTGTKPLTRGLRWATCCETDFETVRGPPVTCTVWSDEVATELTVCCCFVTFGKMQT